MEETIIEKIDTYTAEITTPVPDKVETISIDQVMADIEQAKKDIIRFKEYVADEENHLAELEATKAKLVKLGIKPTPMPKAETIVE